MLLITVKFICVKYIRFRLKDNLTEFGSFVKPRSKNYQNDTVDEETILVVGSVEANHEASSREIARDIGVSKTKTLKILKRYKYKSYHYHKNQYLKPEDLLRRHEFCNWFLRKENEVQNFSDNIIWSDEAHISSAGIFNRQINRYWAKENPHLTISRRAQGKFGFNVWCCLKRHCLVYYIFRGTLNSNQYIEILEHNLENLLDNLPLEERQTVVFQQDGAPAHNALIVRNYLNELFPNNWMGTQGPIKWPARSPDLSPLDFFLWGFLKNKIYKYPSTTEEELRENIERAFEAVQPLQILNATRSLTKRCNSCISHNGGHFEKYL